MSFNPRPKSGLGYFRFRSPLLTESILFFLFLQLLRCFSSLGFTLYNYVFIIRYWSSPTSGFPHSDISGSKITYISPKHFVVCHVLLLLLMPRHSPYALINLITIFVILIWWDFYFSIKSSWYVSRLYISPHYPVFKELLERVTSFKTKQNIRYSTFFSFVFFFLHRKEVIHPHVLVGIPCYDFTPITCPTLNGPLLKG